MNLSFERVYILYSSEMYKMRDLIEMQFEEHLNVAESNKGAVLGSVLEAADLIINPFLCPFLGI